MSTNIPTSRPEIIAACNEALDELFDAYLQQSNTIGSHYYQLISTIKTLVHRGGKRLRPLLTIWAYQGMQGNNPDIIKAAISQELFHSFILMHDDIIDRDNVRWGGLNIAGVYQKTFSKNLSPADSQHYASSMAILAGDVCQSLANISLLETNFPADRLQQACRLLHQTELAMIGGETLDVLLPLDNSFPANDEIITVYRYKTALYTFALPLKIGAILAGAPAATLVGINSFALPLGIAYQLQDDDIGIFGNEHTTGKSTTSDITEGKRTVLMALTMELASKQDKQFLKRLFGQSQLSNSEQQRARSIITNCGARAQAELLTASYIDTALAALGQVGFTNASKHSLKQLVDELLKRRQ